MKKTSLVLFTASVAAGAICPGVSAEQMDMEAMMRWGSAEKVYYTLEGEYSGETSITATMGGLADVSDRVRMTFEWSITEGKLIKLTSLDNYPSSVSNLRDREPKCSPPGLKGPLELATVLEVTNGLGGSIDVKIEKSLPDAEVEQFCTNSRQLIPAEKSIDEEMMPVPSPVILAMGAPATEELYLSADNKSIIVKDGNWTWTYTPSTTPPAQ